MSDSDVLLAFKKGDIITVEGLYSYSCFLKFSYEGTSTTQLEVITNEIVDVMLFESSQINGLNGKKLYNSSSGIQTNAGIGWVLWNFLILKKGKLWK